MNRRAACAMISMAAACFHASLWAGVVAGDVAIHDLAPIPIAIQDLTPIPKQNPEV